MSATYESHLACCPYYHRESGYMIQCDGWQTRQTLTVTFADKCCAAEHKETFCRRVDGYVDCPVYRFVNESTADK